VNLNGKRVLLHRAFIAGIVLKGVDALVQIFGGILLLAISRLIPLSVLDIAVICLI
jgi:uncharacterized membrane protein